MKVYIMSVRGILFSFTATHSFLSTEVITSARVNDDADWVSVQPFLFPFVVQKLTFVHTRNTLSRYVYHSFLAACTLTQSLISGQVIPLTKTGEKIIAHCSS